MNKFSSVAVTGLGPVSAIGNGIDEFWKALTVGASGIRPLQRFKPFTSGCAVAASVSQPEFKPVNAQQITPRATILAREAAQLAVKDAQLDLGKSDAGIVVGTGLGNVDVAEHLVEQMNAGAFLSPGIAFNTFNHITACEIARALDVQGPIQTVSNGCNSGADAIGLAFDWIRLGRAKVVLAGGTENEIAPTFFKAMHACRALSTAHNARPGESSRPFDTKRDGNVPGEGAGFLILEDLDHALQRGAEIKAVISSYVSTASGERQYNPFNPDLSPRHIIRNMTLALEQAGITEKDLSAISANGSSSLLYDAIESAAIESLYQSAQRKIPVFSIKGGLGQTGACTSAFQVLAAAMSVHTGLIPPTINVQQLDSECRINLNVGKALEMPVKHILCNAIGFGGFYYTSLVISRPPYANR